MEDIIVGDVTVGSAMEVVDFVVIVGLTVDCVTVVLFTGSPVEVNVEVVVTIVV